MAFIKIESGWNDVHHRCLKAAKRKGDGAHADRDRIAPWERFSDDAQFFPRYEAQFAQPHLHRELLIAVGLRHANNYRIVAFAK
jgi:hypothetical protein